MSYVHGQVPNKDLVYIDASGVSEVYIPLLDGNNLSDVSNTETARENLDINLIELWVDVPYTVAGTGVKGQVSYNEPYFYTCVNSNTWIRVSGESSW